MVQWIGVRPARRESLVAIDQVLLTRQGIEGDHYQSGGKRSVTLIQYEHLTVIASLLGRNSIYPGDLRRNVAISGINLLGLRKPKVQNW